MTAKPIHLYVGLYETLDAAEEDFADLKTLHESGHVGAYDAAVLSRGADGAVHVDERRHRARRDAFAGVAVGALAGALFPPALLAAAVAGGAAGGLIGHFREGLSRADTAELSAALEGTPAALVVVGDPAIEEQLERVLSRAGTRLAKVVAAEPEAFAAALREAEEQALSAGS
jgi:uncharacterized membrane protein